jgi:hypothetical protein
LCCLCLSRAITVLRDCHDCSRSWLTPFRSRKRSGSRGCAGQQARKRRDTARAYEHHKLMAELESSYEAAILTDSGPGIVAELPSPGHSTPRVPAPTSCKRTRMRSDFPHTRRLPMPRERISTIRNRNRRPKVRCGGRRPGSSARVNSCITRDSGDSFRLPTSIRGSTKAGTTIITRRTLGAICAGSAAFTTF